MDVAYVLDVADVLDVHEREVVGGASFLDNKGFFTKHTTQSVPKIETFNELYTVQKFSSVVFQHHFKVISLTRFTIKSRQFKRKSMKPKTK